MIPVLLIISDRLNRNGEPLTYQELRKAKYGNTQFYALIVELSQLPVFSKIIAKITN